MGNKIKIWRISAAAGASTEANIEPVELPGELDSLDAATRQLPGGGYTTFRTFNRYQVLQFQDHFERLEETARLAGKPLRLDRARIRQAMRQAVDQYTPQGAGGQDVRARLILDLERDLGALYLLLEPLHVPSAQDYERGVKAVTRSLHRDNPKAKLTGFIRTAAEVRQTIPPGVNEAIMIGEDQRALEGLSSNFFAVKQDEIWTAEKEVLSGITRSLVLEEIRAAGIPLRLEGLPLADLPAVDEAFITSASRAVLPVTEIDGRQVGAGVPGPLTRRLMAGYQQRVQARLDSL